MPDTIFKWKGGNDRVEKRISLILGDGGSPSGEFEGLIPPIPRPFCLSRVSVMSRAGSMNREHGREDT